MFNRSTNKKLIWAIIAGFVLTGCGGFLILQNKIPDKVHIAAGQENDINLSLGSFIEEEILEAGNQGTSNIPEGAVHIRCSLFGVIPIKDVEASVVDRSYVTPSGMPVGIYMETDGVLVVGTGTIGGVDGLEYEPALNIVQSGDYIVGINGSEISGKEELINSINQSGGQEIILKVRRNNDLINLKLLPVMTGEAEYKLGLWVRDDTQGIGTLTYIDEQGNFGALGHGVSDVDTSTILALSEGILYHTDILSVTKGERGIPGELSGIIRYQDDQIIGTINANTDTGIYGGLNTEIEAYSSMESVEIAYKQEITTGPATILCAVDGEVKEYNIEIQKININSKEENKSMILKVTDPVLLEKTGGIVQGMSGSPILQNGRLIGAVTHVFIQDSTSGFGIFIENMLRVD